MTIAFAARRWFSNRFQASVPEHEPVMLAADEEEADARRAVRRLLTSVDAVAHARAAGALAARPTR